MRLEIVLKQAFKFLTDDDATRLATGLLFFPKPFAKCLEHRSSPCLIFSDTERHGAGKFKRTWAFLWLTVG